MAAILTNYGWVWQRTFPRRLNLRRNGHSNRWRCGGLDDLNRYDRLRWVDKTCAFRGSRVRLSTGLALTSVRAETRLRARNHLQWLVDSHAGTLLLTLEHRGSLGEPDPFVVQNLARIFKVGHFRRV